MVAGVLPEVFISKLFDEIFNLLKTRIKSSRKTDIVAVAMFDLPESTKIKLEKGHSYGTQMAIEHNLICKKIAEQYQGEVIKHMGDGIFIKFNDPEKACLAAINIKKATTEKAGFSTKGGITLGKVEIIEIEGIQDLMGSTIDRCARLASLAFPNQILIDSVLLGSTESFLRDNEEILISDSKKRAAKGIGEILTYEISSISLGLTGHGISYLNVMEEGRIPLSDKMSFMSDAKKEIIELGIGLSSFSEYFHRQRFSSFMAIIENLLKKDVIIRCLMLNPDGNIANIYVKNDVSGDQYLERMKLSLKRLIAIKKEFEDKGYDGFKIYLYDSIPKFHACCVDLELQIGKISVSHYLPYTLRSNNPVIQFSSTSNPEMFEKYGKSIKTLLNKSSEVH